ncbi:hypothetical protein BZM27_48085 [Paraburkholderia steynii]|uniref:Uncharacterized protein n=1 Tax=Paraburkholderia steynii TaxID=1245441 RepID=A0A4R0XC30_9BURK|nr:hypothetical protein BZM27_48085 [Paraburkholderia steynii]
MRLATLRQTGSRAIEKPFYPENKRAVTDEAGMATKIWKAPSHQARLAFAVELARAASYIASTLTTKSTLAAVTEVLEQFVVDRGSGGLDQFCNVLVDDLEKRGCAYGVVAVKSYLRAGPRGDA